MGLLFVTMFSLGWRLAADFVVWGVCRLFLSWGGYAALFVPGWVVVGFGCAVEFRV